MSRFDVFDADENRSVKLLRNVESVGIDHNHPTRMSRTVAEDESVTRAAPQGEF
jgi:hypothetical protein